VVAFLPLRIENCLWKFVLLLGQVFNTPVFSRERSSTGSNDCFVVVVLLVVVLVVVLVVGIFIL
jgi:hypothetical protein